MSRRRTKEIAGDTGDIWTAYADLLVSLLMVFALLLFVALRSYEGIAKGAKEAMDRNREAVDSAVAALPKGAGVSFDSATGSLTLNSNVLFAFDSSILRPGARAMLVHLRSAVLPRLLKTPAVDTSLQEIAVVGHTDTVGSYRSNLDLSYRRARAVMDALLDTLRLPDGHERRLQELLVASGRSEAEPRREHGQIVDSLSRRIEIHFRFRNDAVLKDMLGKLLGDSLPRPGVQGQG